LPKEFNIVETYWHDHSLESSWVALSDGTISFLIQWVSGKCNFWNFSVLYTPASIGCPHSGGRFFCFASPESLTHINNKHTCSTSWLSTVFRALVIFVNSYFYIRFNDTVLFRCCLTSRSL
jgi:hypothetical protein